MMGDLTKNFSRGEMACQDGTPWPASEEKALQALAKDLQTIRDAWGGTIRVMSAYRPLDYNRNVGSKDTSMHTDSSDVKYTPPCAVDLTPATARAREVYALNRVILALINVGAICDGGLGLYDGFTHYDQRALYGRPAARW